jgi:hypothetical protein
VRVRLRTACGVQVCRGHAKHHNPQTEAEARETQETKERQRSRVAHPCPELNAAALARSDWSLSLTPSIATM